MSDAAKRPHGIASDAPRQSSETRRPPRAIDLVRRLRKTGTGPLRDTVRIRTVTPSLARWGEWLSVTADYPDDQRPVLILRCGSHVFRLPAKQGDKSLECQLPEAPADVHSPAAAQLFVSAGRTSEDPVLMRIYDGPVLRRATREANDEWSLEGSGFGDDREQLRVELSGKRQARILHTSPTEIRFAVEITGRTPVRVVAGDRHSNFIQIDRVRHGRAR